VRCIQDAGNKQLEEEASLVRRVEGCIFGSLFLNDSSCEGKDRGIVCTREATLKTGTESSDRRKIARVAGKIVEGSPYDQLVDDKCAF